MHCRFLWTVFLTVTAAVPVSAIEPIDIGSRRELFVDDFLVDAMRGDARLELQRPVPREIVFQADVYSFQFLDR